MQIMILPHNINLTLEWLQKNAEEMKTLEANQETMNLVTLIKEISESFIKYAKAEADRKIGGSNGTRNK
jgi:hypothetical protein